VPLIAAASSANFSSARRISSLIFNRVRVNVRVKVNVRVNDKLKRLTLIPFLILTPTLALSLISNPNL
jgi:hypothetical protein